MVPVSNTSFSPCTAAAVTSRTTTALTAFPMASSSPKRCVQSPISLGPTTASAAPPRTLTSGILGTRFIPVFPVPTYCWYGICLCSMHLIWIMSASATLLSSTLEPSTLTTTTLTMPICCSQNASKDEPSFYLNWFLDPEYTLFYGCQCQGGMDQVWHTVMGGLRVPQCIPTPPTTTPWAVQYFWVFIIIAALVFIALSVGAWCAQSHFMN